MNFPNDDDGDALRRMVEAGFDLSRPMAIEFTIDVPDRSAGQAVAAVVQKAGYQVLVEHDVEDNAWTCYCIRHMIPSYDAVVAGQAELNRLAAPHGGHCDGWGGFGNAKGD